MNRDDIIRKVMLNLDEMVPEGLDDIIQQEPLPIYDQVDQLLDDCTNDILKTVPLQYCSTIENVSLVYNKNYFVVPTGYLRFGSAMCSDWESSVTRLVRPEYEPDLYKIIKNPIITKGIANPYAAITTKVVEEDGVDTTKEVIELYNTEETSTTLTYVKSCLAEDLDNRLVPALSWLCATKILLITGRKEAEVANSTYNEQIKLLL